MAQIKRYLLLLRSARVALPERLLRVYHDLKKRTPTAMSDCAEPSSCCNASDLRFSLEPVALVTASTGYHCKTRRLLIGTDFQLEDAKRLRRPIPLLPSSALSHFLLTCSGTVLFLQIHHHVDRLSLAALAETRLAREQHIH